MLLIIQSSAVLLYHRLGAVSLSALEVCLTRLVLERLFFPRAVHFLRRHKPLAVEERRRRRHRRRLSPYRVGLVQPPVRRVLFPAPPSTAQPAALVFFLACLVSLVFGAAYCAHSGDSSRAHTKQRVRIYVRRCYFHLHTAVR